MPTDKPADTCPKLSNEALLTGIETAARMISTECNAAERTALWLSLTQYVECLQARGGASAMPDPTPLLTTLRSTR